MPKGTPLDLSSGTKHCPRCKQTKPLGEFGQSKYTIAGYAVYCKPCMVARHDEWRRANLDYCRRASKKWRDTNPRLAKDHTLRSRYGVPLGTYEKLIVKQEGKCAICQTTNPGGKGDFHIDHCHNTSHIRGLLCHGCNVSIGHFQHDVSILKAAINYLSRTSC